MTHQTATLATNLDDLFRACDPEKPLAADDTQRYVDLSGVRGMKNLADSITRQIRRSHPDYHQQLVTGHRGCGKSTELLRQLFREKRVQADKRCMRHRAQLSAAIANHKTGNRR